MGSLWRYPRRGGAPARRRSSSGCSPKGSRRKPARRSPQQAELHEPRASSRPCRPPAPCAGSGRSGSRGGCDDISPDGALGRRTSADGRLGTRGRGDSKRSPEVGRVQSHEVCATCLTVCIRRDTVANWWRVERVFSATFRTRQLYLRSRRCSGVLPQISPCACSDRSKALQNASNTAARDRCRCAWCDRTGSLAVIDDGVSSFSRGVGRIHPQRDRLEPIGGFSRSIRALNASGGYRASPR